MKDTIGPSVPAFACLVMAVMLSFGSKEAGGLAIAFTVLTSCFAVLANIIIRMRREMRGLQERLSKLQQTSNASASGTG